MKLSLRPQFLLIFCGLSGLMHLSLRADEIHSNGHGGGKWSSADTWEEKHVPAGTDTVVIASGDTVIFDRDDTTVISCAALSLDPEAQFEFENTGKKVLRVNGSIEAYGHIRLDGSQSADSQLEIQLLGDQARSFSLFKGGGLLMSGLPNLPDNRKNVVLKGIDALSSDHKPILCTFDAGTGTSLEIKNAQFENFTLTCTGINNTGLQPNERLNFNESRFTASQIELKSCDTPRIAGNTFAGRTTSPQAAITITNSPMAEVKGNHVSTYPVGISNYPQDAMIMDNVIEKCGKGIVAVHAANTMIRGGSITDCPIGIDMNGCAGVIEEVKIVNCPVGIFALNGAGFQANNVTFTLPAEGDKWAISVKGGSAVLLNCNVAPSQVKVEGPFTGDPAPVVTSLQYVIAKVGGTLPPNAQIAIQSDDAAKAKPGAADPNVRNSPASLRLSDGLSALPFTQGALIARIWSINREGKVQPASPYKLSVVIPTGSVGAKKEIKSISIKPDDSWFRPDLKSEKPTAELSL